MAYYGRRRMHPATAARKEREREREASSRAEIAKGQKRLARIFTRYKKGPLLTGEESARAWKAAKSTRSYRTGTYQGDAVYDTLRTDGENLYLQEAGHMGWNFYKLSPIKKRKRHKLRSGTRVRKAMFSTDRPSMILRKRAR